MMDLGRLAYDTYGDERGWKVHDGGPMPGWDDQSEELRAAWSAAANAVAHRIRMEFA